MNIQMAYAKIKYIHLLVLKEGWIEMIDKQEIYNLLDAYKGLVSNNFDRLKPTNQWAMRENLKNSLKSFEIKEYYKDGLK